ncbi:17S U2 SnRNP complex component HTATSF1-like [Littorina saxatilis]|uniref:17S U2 SnRNP complex component HTATSF1 n=1 Tax=Littorina saxatilis TaxID=31220 RepID=A0AAN9GG59_9CAEN
MAEEEEFEDQLEQQKVAKVEEEEKEAASRGLTYKDDDGMVMEWDPAKRAYFPQIDNDFIARYQMNYGVDTSQTGNDPKSATVTKGNDATAPTTDDPQAWQDYYNSYNQKTDENASTDPDAQNADQQNYSDSDWYSYYYHYYGEDYAMKWWNSRLEEKEEEEEEKKEKEGVKDDDKEVKDGQGNGKKKGKGKEAEKRKAPDEPPSWFDMEDEKSTHVYVSNLPSDITDEEFQELMAKCGLIMFDPHNRKPKLKLYRNSDGTLKGDGLCCYIKQESVELALNILDGSNVNGNIISVERAKFQLKGAFDPAKKKKKLSNKAKRKLKERQAKLFDWRPDLVVAARLRYERIVVLKNMFDEKEFETDPALINELREDVRIECSKFGDVRKVQVHDHHTEGVISVTFRTPEEADACIAALNGRWFAAKRISAETYDGKTEYDVNETDAEREERLRGWETFLESDADGKKISQNSNDSGEKSRPEGDNNSSVSPGGTTRSGDASVADSTGVAGAAGASSELAESENMNTSDTEAAVSAPSTQDSEGGAAN